MYVSIDAVREGGSGRGKTTDIAPDDFRVTWAPSKGKPSERLLVVIARELDVSKGGNEGPVYNRELRITLTPEDLRTLVSAAFNEGLLQPDFLRQIGSSSI